MKGLNLFRHPDQTCFYDACYFGDLTLAKRLSKSDNVDIHAEDEYGFGLACYHGKEKVAKWLYRLSNNIAIDHVNKAISTGGGFRSKSSMGNWLTKIGVCYCEKPYDFLSYPNCRNYLKNQYYSRHIKSPLKKL